MAGQDSSAVSTCSKYTLFFLNILFWLIGLALLAVGIYVKSLKELGSVFKSTVPWYFDPSIYFIIIGAAIFIIAFLGCIGALRENICMLKTFEYIIYLLMLLELGGALGLYFAKDKAKGVVKDALKKTIPNYRDDIDLQSIIDYFQENVKCCGIDTYDDWESNIYFNCSSPGAEACGVPYSCCKNFQVEQNTQCGYKMRCIKQNSQCPSAHERRNKIYTTGCVDATIDLFLSKNNLYYFIGAGAGLIVLQLVTTGLAHSLINGVRTQLMKQQREAKRVHGFDNTAFNR
ncbi:tetraspanin-33-like [Rhopilema esculentum]|uniref:tetraspanin-33-like n=1 Tax=Rhopilema esculentum TaxID=499914 RepID=UPI0031D49D84